MRLRRTLRAFPRGAIVTVTAVTVGVLLAVAEMTAPASGLPSRAAVPSYEPSADPSNPAPPSNAPTDPPDRGLSVVIGLGPKFNLTVNRENRKLIVLISKSDTGQNCTISEVEKTYPDEKLPKPKDAKDDAKIVNGAVLYVLDYGDVTGKVGVKVVLTVKYKCPGDTEDQTLNVTFLYNDPDDPKKAPTFVKLP